MFSEQAESLCDGGVLRSLLERMDEGVVLAFVLLDERGYPSDLRYLSSNPAAVRALRLLEAEGNGGLIRELALRVARTGTDERLQIALQRSGSWAELHAFRLGPDGRQLAIVLGRACSERTEEHRLILRELGEALRPLSDPVQIQIEAARVLTERLDACRVAYDEACDDVLQGFGEGARLLRAGRPLLRGGAGSPCCVTVPLLRDGQVAALLALTRQQPAVSPQEVALLEEATERIGDALERAHAIRDEERRKDDFLAILAHELRNPLAPLRTGLEVLRRSGGEPPTLRTIDTMERQLSHMVRLIDDLLDVSRINRGKVELRREVVPLRSVVEAAIEEVRPLIEAARHRFVLELPEEPLAVVGDATRLAQIVGNLLDNATKYTPQGGRLGLCIHAVDGEAGIDVSDSGVGIPRGMLGEVFEMFTQVDRLGSRAQGGLGIGLALVRSLVEMHGGRVWADSEGPGQGSTFSVRLPLAPRAEPHCDDRAGMPAGVRAVKVLVIDDNADAAEMLAMLLELGGHQAMVALGGRQGIEIARSFRPEIAFVDIGMPDLNGYEVARSLRCDPELDQTLLVALTGWGSPEDKQRAMAAGFDHHLTKPVDCDAVEALLAPLASRGE